MIPELSEAACNKLTPLIRAHFVEGILGTKVTVSAVTENAVLKARRRGKGSLVDVADAMMLTQLLKRIKQVAFDDIASVEVWRGGKRTRLATLRIKSPKQSLALRLPYDEAEHFLGMLHTRLGERMTMRSGVPLHGWGLNLFLLIALSSVAGLIIFAQEWTVGGVIFVFSVLPLLIVQIYDHVPASFPWEISDKQKKRKPAKDRSGVEPYRSRLIGWMLKIFSVLVLIGLWIGGLMLFAPIALLLLYIGNQIASVPPKLVRESDKRSPILYLRSFLDDRITNLTPDTKYAIALGVMPPRFLPTPWRYLFYFHPVRVLRILFGAGVDTSEEQLALFFRRLGPFVAIGRPGERFASPGASRMYVTNEEWQNVVLQHLKTAQIVVLQPAKTEGIWWEVEKTIGQVDPQKVLLCMVNFHRRQNDYEKFRLRAEQFLNHPLPRNLAYTQTASFVYFDDDWKSFVQEVSCRSPMIWPVVGNPVDLRYTLAPFLESANAVHVAHTANAKDVEESNASRAPGTKAERVELELAEQHTAKEQQKVQLLPSMLPRAPRGIGRGDQLTANVVYLGAIILLPMVPLLVAGVGAARRAAQRVAAAGVEANAPDPARTAVETESKLGEAPVDEAGALKLRGMTLYNEGKLESALAELARSIELKDTDPQSFLFRGDVLESMQRREEAIKDYERALELEPKYDLAWNNLGYAYMQMKKFGDATKSYSKAIELNDKNASFFANRGLAYLSENQLDQAIADFTRSLEIDSKQPLIYYLQGQALAKKGKWIDAIKHFNTAVQLNPDNTDVYFHRGKAFIAIGDQKSSDFNPYDYARQNFDEYYKRSPNVPRILLDHAEVNRLDGKLDDAIADVARFLELVPGDNVALERRVDIYFEAKQYDNAISDAETLIRTNPDDPAKKVLLASLLFAMKRYDEAIAQTDTIIKQHPDNLMARRVRGNCLMRLRRYDESLLCFADVLKTQTQDPVSLANRAQIFAIQSRYDESAAEYQKLVDGQPDQFDPQYFFSYALAGGHRWDELKANRSSLSTSFANSPNPKLQLLIARIALLGPSQSSFDWSPGKALLKDLHDANPDNLDVALLFGTYQFHTSQFAEAEATLNTVLEKATEPRIIASAQLWLCQAQARLGMLNEAKESFKKAESWIQQNGSLDVVKEQPEEAHKHSAVDAGLEWWQSVELQDWMAMARATLNRSQSEPEGYSKPSKDSAGMETRINEEKD